ncbi:PREDICTED: uncharacterized protein LOC109591333 [Amphimedon queenslandica]|uniref:Vacuolar membrane-associated protein Iml1 N-terminal domain-containing protein n=1 Tax=Amphimedon queenslandica TaxID=400682 RepID=A0AAN0K057_AMPQE|nr:PREDICTED: uncharacterized protein LOC109591333 [Amphimedon queenslandica]|eukprot:XP_019862644.1 PREDICTED: uncharacterized protein LOC109591333 [Amphimedon queenslandica]
MYFAPTLDCGLKGKLSRVECMVTGSTRIVFRSASLQFFLFMQFSSEIWELDPNGDTLMKQLMVFEGSLLRLEGVIPLINSVKGVRPLIERYRTHNSSRTSTSLCLMLPKTLAERTRS